MQPVQTSLQVKVQQLALLQIASHQLPSVPPLNHWDCLAFQQISHRLTVWDQFHHLRTGEEFMFKNYYNESRIGPELLWAIYPCRISHSFPEPGSDRPSIHSTQSTYAEGYQQSLFYSAVESSHVPTNSNRLSASRLTINPPSVAATTPFVPIIQKPPIDKNQTYSFFAQNESVADYLPSSILGHRKQHFSESSMEAVLYKRQKVLSA